MSQRTSSGATPSMFDVIRTPPSSSTIAGEPDELRATKVLVESYLGGSG